MYIYLFGTKHLTYIRNHVYMSVLQCYGPTSKHHSFSINNVVNTNFQACNNKIPIYRQSLVTKKMLLVARNNDTPHQQ